MKKQFLRKSILVWILLLSLLPTMILPVFAEDQKESGQTDWMEAIDGNLTLAQFTIPGTHDSCTNKCIVGRCQFVGVKEQLDMGVRFLDIRLKVEGDELNCYHGFVDCNISFAYVVKTVKSFLKEHPSECVILSIRNEDGNNAELEKILVGQWIDTAEKGLWYTEERMPTLNEVRGKIVLLRRYRNYDTNLARGLDASELWQGSRTFTIERKGYVFAIQDNYKYETLGLNFGKKKWQAFEAMDKAIAINDPDNRSDLLWLNFASGCNTIGCGTLSCAAVVNENIRMTLKDTSGNHGIIIMDYAEPATVRLVYRINFN